MSIRRKMTWPLLIPVALAALGCWVILPMQRRQAAAERKVRRQAWLDQTTAELKASAQNAPRVGSETQAPAWQAGWVLRFKDGWAIGRVHTIHSDNPEQPELGDLAVLIDSAGRVVHSKMHFCDGSLPGAVGDLSPGADFSSFRNAADSNGYTNLFTTSMRPENRWTTERSEVLDWP